jgi:GNAT superfamily N-acetyltransferase
MNTNDMKLALDIRPLTDKPEHLETLAKWHHAEWSYLNPERSFAERLEEMSLDLAGHTVPATYYAEVDGVLAGSATILDDDMSTHPELGPWLASVFVAPEYRHRGIASVLVGKIMAHARQAKISKLYLYTPGQEALYEKLGWQTDRRENYNGTDVTIMSVALA